MDENRNKILERILALKAERKWSKRKFAEICKIYPQHVNSYLDGTFGFENLLEGLAKEGEDVYYILTGQSNKTTGAPLGANLVKDKQEEYRRELFELKEQIKLLTQRVEKYETDNTVLRNLLALLLKENLSLEAKNMILSVLNSQIENPNVKIKEAPG